MTDEIGQLSRQWKEEGLRYASEVNAFVRRGLASNWQEVGPEPSEDTRGELASRVFRYIQQANRSGDTETLRERFPPASWPFNKSHQQLMRAVQPVALLTDGSALLAGRNKDQTNAIYVADLERVTQVEHLRAASCSADGRDVALMDERGVRVVREPDRTLQGRLLAAYTWEDIIRRLREKYPEIETLQEQSYQTADVIPFANGQKLLFVSHDGIYLIEENGVLLLHPSEEELKEQADGDELNASLAMPHGAVSRDGKWIAFGSQGSEHLLLDVDRRIVYPIEPASSYPHYCLFSSSGQQVWFNACHFYNGDTIRVSLTSLEADIESGDWPSMNGEMRVYAGVALREGNILGDAYGYLRLIDHEGQELWRYHVSGTISGMALSPDEKTLLVGTYSGMLHWVDLTEQEPDPYCIGTAPIREIRRWIVWENKQPLLW
ncbi:hypothetical protein PV433_23780 [Paenibacillus sp. GYB004]|uniref:PQQ-binding-like beta-propeller repeat protein n=1 Tax=Paenibacillus sp. GYB004 TaxID=2994393 RepID=UPI002F96A208